MFVCHRVEDVEKALEISQNKQFFGCKIDVSLYDGCDVEDNEFRPLEAELDEYHAKATRTLFVGNLEKDITATDLKKHFDTFGEIIVSVRDTVVLTYLLSIYYIKELINDFF